MNQFALIFITNTSNLQLGFQFMADMINRLFFLLIVVGEIIGFCVTILTTIASISSDGRLDMIKQLEG